jgi:hypothetical protein
VYGSAVVPEFISGVAGDVDMLRLVAKRGRCLQHRPVLPASRASIRCMNTWLLNSYFVTLEVIFIVTYFACDPEIVSVI